MQLSTHPTDPRPLVPISGLDLRYGLIVALHARREPATLSQLVDQLLEWGLAPVTVTTRQRPSSVGAPTLEKIVSDALRWEVRKGRVRRVGRGIYRAGPEPPSTTWRRMRAVVEGRRLGLNWVNGPRPGTRRMPVPSWPG